MTDFITDPLFPGYLLAGFVLACAVVAVSLWIQNLQDLEGGSF